MGSHAKIPIFIGFNGQINRPLQLFKDQRGRFIAGGMVVRAYVCNVSVDILLVPVFFSY